MIDYPAEAVVHQYMEDVLENRIPACQWVRLACQRHLNDLERGEERGLYFDPAAGQLVISFFGLLKHSKGEWAGTSIKLEPWQQFILWVLFGWKREDGSRRFRICYLEVPRKNGKSTVAAGVGLYLMVADNEPGAEIYSVATHREQAKITHSEATRMVKASQALQKRCKIYVDNIHIPNTASKFQPLGRDSNTMDGLNIHGAIIDELHAHKTREVVDLMETGKSARRQPMQFEITTAGHDRHSICYEHHEYSKKVLQGVIENDAWFGIIFTFDEEDDYYVERTWFKANPNLGISKKLEYMQEQAQKAKDMPSETNKFLRLDLNVWTQSVTKWIPREHWDACGQLVDPIGLQGRRCYAGLDLSSNIDISSYSLVFPPETIHDPYQVIMRFFIPEEAMHIRSHRDRVPYDAWVRQGYITATSGNVIDYDYILEMLRKDLGVYDIEQLAFDRWGATQITIKIQDDLGIECVQFGQGYQSMNSPMKDLERLIRQHTMAHGNNPVLNWMADNLVVDVDAAGNIKPDKEKSIERIDGMVAMVMGLDLAIRHKKSGSVYEERGIREL